MSLLSKLGSLIWYVSLAYVGIGAAITAHGVLKMHTPMSDVWPVIYISALVLTVTGTIKMVLGHTAPKQPR